MVENKVISIHSNNSTHPKTQFIIMVRPFLLSLITAACTIIYRNIQCFAIWLPYNLADGMLARIWESLINVMWLSHTYTHQKSTQFSWDKDKLVKFIISEIIIGFTNYFLIFSLNGLYVGVSHFCQTKFTWLAEDID